MPPDPAGWLYRTARNLAIDALRRERTHVHALPRLTEDAERESSPLDAHFADEIGDEPLRMLFVCCHEAVPAEYRVAIALKTLDRIAPSPLHSLNRAVAEAYLHGAQAGLDRLAGVPPENVPARYPGWHTVKGELHFRLGRHAAAERAWREALRFTTARADREFLRRRLAACRPDGGEPATEIGPA